MAVGLTGQTCGYLLITGITATVQAQLLCTVLTKLHEIVVQLNGIGDGWT